MMESTTRRHSLVAICLASVLALTVGCSSQAEEQPSESPDPTTGVVPELAELLPDDIRERGVIVSGSPFTNSMLYTLDAAGEPAGILVELFEEAAKRFGVDIEWVTFGGLAELIPALQSAKIEAAAGVFTRTQDNATQAHYIAAWQEWQTLLVRIDDVDEFTTQLDLCGRIIGTSETSAVVAQVRDALTQKCANAGREAPSYKLYPGDAATITALRSGQVEGVISGTINQSAVAKEVGDGKELAVVLKEKLGAARITGFAVDAENLQLAEAFAAAIQSMMDDGFYQKLFADAGLGESTTIDTAYLDEKIPSTSKVLVDE